MGQRVGSDLGGGVRQPMCRVPSLCIQHVIWSCLVHVICKYIFLISVDWSLIHISSLDHHHPHLSGTCHWPFLLSLLILLPSYSPPFSSSPLLSSPLLSSPLLSSPLLSSPLLSSPCVIVLSLCKVCRSFCLCSLLPLTSFFLLGLGFEAACMRI
jgi:hypothetical protein